jgi:predicted ATPase
MKDGELETLQRTAQGVTRERMLRELAEALEVLTAEHPLVLVLEDLHWSDLSTADLLTAVAQRREAARLLVLGSYRPADVVISGHPLKAVKQELQLHRQCTELPLTFLSVSDVTQYLAGRFPQHQFPPELVGLLHRHTEGNPLFLVTTVEDLVARQVIGEQDGQWQLHDSLEQVTLGVPVTIQQMIGRHFERLSAEEQHVLEAAGVAGESFSAAAVAAGLEAESDRVEAWCEGLARREQFLQAQELVTWPDGTIAGRYRFVHALYQQVMYERIGAARRVQLHWRIGERLETGYGERVNEIAAELAVHFE